jgi:uncharacterized protein (TIRG00374 family)
VKLNVRGLLAVVLAFVLLYGVFAVWRGLGSIQSALESYRWLTFAAACALAFGNYLFRFVKWEFYLSRLEIRGVPKYESFLVFLSGFVLTVSPGKVGEVFKSYVLAATHKVPIARTGPIVIAERVTDLIGIIVLIVAGSLGFAGGLLWAGVGAVLVVLLLVVVGSRTLSMKILGMMERFPGPVGRIAPKLHAAYDSLALLLHPRNLLFPTLLALVSWSLECLSLWVILRGFGQSTSVELCAFFYATSTLIGALIPVPGGLGFTEGALEQQMIHAGGVPRGVSTAAMILVRLATLWFAVLVGFVALSLLRLRYPGLLATGGESADASSTTDAAVDPAAPYAAEAKAALESEGAKEIA